MGYGNDRNSGRKGRNDRNSGRREGGFNRREEHSGGGFNRGGHGGGFNRGPREMHKAICAECNKECDVPFKPVEGKPVYCRDCFQKHKKF